MEMQLRSLVDPAKFDQFHQMLSKFRRITIDGSKINPLFLKACGYDHVPEKVECIGYGPKRPCVFNVVPRF